MVWAADHGNKNSAAYAALNAKLERAVSLFTFVSSNCNDFVYVST